MPPQIGMVDLNHVLPMLRLFIFEKCARGINRRRRQTPRLKLFEEALYIVRHGACLDDPVEQRPQGEPVLHGLKFGIEKLRRISQPLDKTLPMIRLIAKNTRITVLAFVSFRDGRCLAVAGSLENLAGDAVPGDNPEERIGDENILKRNLYMVAAPRGAPVVESHQGPESRMDRSQTIRHVTWTNQGRAARMTAEIHQSAHGESDDIRRFEITIRARETEAGNRSHY